MTTRWPDGSIQSACFSMHRTLQLRKPSEVPLPQDSAAKTTQSDFHNGDQPLLQCSCELFQRLRAIPKKYILFTVHRNKSSSEENIPSFSMYLKSNFTLPLNSSVICLDFITASASEVQHSSVTFLLRHMVIPVITGAAGCSLPALTLCATNASSDFGSLAFDGACQSLD